MKNFILGLAVLSTVMMKAQTQIIAHRGYFQAQPPTTENSIQSLENAQKLKIYGSEFDVRMTKDGVLVINHDEHHGTMEISETNFSDLRKLKLSNGEKLPTLYEYISEGMRNNKHTLLVCEIKPSEISKERGQKTGVAAVETIKKLKADKNTCYISFDYDILKKIRAIDPKTSLQYLEGNKSPKEVKADKINGVDYHYSVFKKHPEWIQEAKENKIILNAWTVNEATDMDWIIDHKFNYITTNEPELLQERLEIKK